MVDPQYGRIARMVAKLNLKTQDGSLVWRLEHPPSDIGIGTDDRIPVFYVADLAEQTIALYPLRFKDYSPDLDEFVWREQPVLAFFDDSSRKVWETVNPDSGLEDLLESVQYQTAEVDEFIDRLFTDEFDD